MLNDWKDAPGVLIVGAGWIGRQVGLRMAICGLRVAFADRSHEVLKDARAWMEDQAPHYLDAIEHDPPASSETASHENAGNESSKAPCFNAAEAALWHQRVAFGLPLADLAGRIEVVLECVSEQVGLKRRVLREYSREFPKQTVIASNSSYFTPSTLAQYVDMPERFAHWHFHVPLHRSSIADISGCGQTEPWVIERLTGLSERIGQYPLRLRREQSGYVFNWMLQSLLRSALELAAKDVVSIEDIDRAWKSVSGMALGPFAMMDHIGLDTIEQALANARWDDSEPIAIERLLAVLRQPIAEGRIGVKSGRGFYDHRNQDTP